MVGVLTGSIALLGFGLDSVIEKLDDSTGMPARTLYGLFEPCRRTQSGFGLF